MIQVLTSATGAEVGAAFYVAQEAIPLRNMLEDLGHVQLAIPLECDNKCAT